MPIQRVGGRLKTVSGLLPLLSNVL